MAQGAAGQASSGSHTAEGLQGVGSPPQSITDRKVDSLFREWKEQLQTQKDGFVKQAEQISGWDADLRSHHLALLSLAAETHELTNEEAKLDRRLGAISSHLDGIDACIDDLRMETSSLMQRSAGSGSHTADMARAQYYKLADDVAAQLAEAEAKLESLTRNISGLASADSSSGSMDAVQRTIEAHMRTMQWVNSTVEALETEARQLDLQQIGGLQ